MRPPCHNRPPRAAGTLEPTGRHVLRPVRAPADTFEPRDVEEALAYKPVYRWRPSAFEDRCATWDGRGIGPNGEPYPQAHGWDCTGCRWLPTELSTVSPVALRQPEEQHRNIERATMMDRLFELPADTGRTITIDLVQSDADTPSPAMTLISTPHGAAVPWWRTPEGELAKIAVSELAKPPPSLLEKLASYTAKLTPIKIMSDPTPVALVMSADRLELTPVGSFADMVEMPVSDEVTALHKLADDYAARVRAHRDEVVARARFLGFPEELALQIDAQFQSPITADSKL